MLWLDTKYVNLVSFHLQGFVQKKVNLWNSWCLICGDDDHKKGKRFYIHQGKRDHSQDLMCTCHNCGYHKELRWFLRDVDVLLYREYTLERFTQEVAAERFSGGPSYTVKQTASTLPAVGDDILTGLQRISELHPNHSARVYCVERKIPDFAMDEFRWSDDFKAVASKLNAESARDLRENDPRIVIPFLDADNDVTIIQGRTIDQMVKPKYIAIKMNDSVDKVYGLSRVDRSRPIIVLEGPVDSLFVDNAVATGDSDLTRFSAGSSYVFDNQPRSYEIVKKVQRAISQGYPVFLWSSAMLGFDGKDINDLVREGKVEAKDLHNIIMDHTYTGMKARMEFIRWRKV